LSLARIDSAKTCGMPCQIRARRTPHSPSLQFARIVEQHFRAAHLKEHGRQAVEVGEQR
jgi:hypothetical protein